MLQQARKHRQGVERCSTHWPKNHLVISASTYGASYKTAIERQNSPAPTASYADTVTLSAEAKTLAASEGSPVFTQPRTHAQENLLRAASSDVSPGNNKQATGTRGGASLRWQSAAIENTKEFPSYGEKVTHDFAYDDSGQSTGPLIDISNRPTIRYSYTGEVVTDQNLSEFKAEAATARIERIALYEAEKTKGTPDAGILEKLFRYSDSRSDRYLNIVGWERSVESAG